LKCDHGVWLTAANVIAMGAASLLPLVSGAVEDALLRWARAAELTCDRAALLVVGDSRVVASALMKLAGGSPALAAELNVDAFLRQARSYDELTLGAGPLGWFLRSARDRPVGELPGVSEAAREGGAHGIACCGKTRCIRTKLDEGHTDRRPHLLLPPPPRRRPLTAPAPARAGQRRSRSLCGRLGHARRPPLGRWGEVARRRAFAINAASCAGAGSYFLRK
jgi:hypothetical protein